MAKFLSPLLLDKSDFHAYEIASRLTGLFTTLEQVKQDILGSASYQHAAVYQRIAPIELPGLAGIALYIEQGVFMPDSPPYRVRVYQIASLASTGEVVSRIFKIKNEQAVVGAFVDPTKLAALSLEELDEQCGCQMSWNYQDAEDLYIGVTGAGCITAKGTRLEAEARLSKSVLLQKDVGFDTDGVQVMGPPKGVSGHAFAKLSQSAIATQIVPLPSAASASDFYLDI